MTKKTTFFNIIIFRQLFYFAINVTVIFILIFQENPMLYLRNDIFFFLCLFDGVIETQYTYQNWIKTFNCTNKPTKIKENSESLKIGSI